MFSSPKTPSKKGTAGSLDLGSLGIEGLDDLDLPADDDLSEMDFDDPDLLRELSALSSGIQQSKSKQKPKPQPPKAKLNHNSISVPGDIDIEALGALGADDDEVEFNEEDMKDPNLLRELQELGGGGHDEKDEINRSTNEKLTLKKTQIETSSVKASDNLQTKTQITTSSVKTSDNLQTEVDVTHDVLISLQGEPSLEVMLQSNDVNVLAKYIQEEKLNAIMKKREGDKVGAVESMKAYKQLEAKRAQILSQSKRDSKIEVGSSPSSQKLDDLSKNFAEQASLSSPVSQNTRKNSEISPQNQKIIDTLSQRFKQYKEAAVAFKSSNNVPRAEECINTATIIYKTMKSLKNGDELPEGWEIPGEPDVSKCEIVSQSTVFSSTTENKTQVNITPVSTPKKKVLTVLDNATNLNIMNEDEQPFAMISKEDQYARLITQLESQVDLCTTISAYYLKTGNKTLAATFYRYKKSFVADLTSLISYRTHSKNVPAFHFQDITYCVENAFLHLSANDMEIGIERAYNLGNKDVNGKDVDAYVSWDLGWPTEGSPGAGSGKGDTSTATRGMDPEFNWKKIINIERTKAFQRYLNSKKATFEVFHYRGFLRKDISLGKATVKLDQLLSKAEIHEVFNLVDHVRKPTGGKLEIRLRLRTPLINPDIISKTEKWLIIDEFNANNPAFASFPSTPQASTSSPALTPARNTSSPTLAQTPIKPKVVTPQTPPPPSTPTPIKNETPQISTPVAKQKVARDTPATATPSRDIVSADDAQSELEQAEQQLNNVDLLVSSLVIQNELDVVNNQITILEAQRKPIPEDLTDRKASLDIKQNLLVIQVETGQLTLDKYIDQVRANIVSCKKLALIFKKAGKLEEAKKALVRSKIMEGEVNEVEEAMASGAMG
ncbi:16096_t:CDS:2 [Funneliformis geosporum]|uniref:7339_t:CDS:1 n=1 Tax=Funneliformis geosporum TaxID=1117311 RepID=A0A9W4SIJ2_9GLOM|nr:16096_t:CDS:2 [Funneliformis geosporum]CAI2170729.1 7339_t:CDS:2 [Funneliformis geosporum]